MDSKNTLPRISVITPTLNQGRYIEYTIQSVIAQAYPNFEHIVVDGGSTDGTLEVLKKYPHLKWVSEKDNGQADALNKGVALASGDVIAWLNSDDYYCLNTFHTIADAFGKRPYAKVIVGQTLLLFENTMISNVSQNRELDFEDMIRYWDEWIPPTQPSVFFKSGLFDEAGLFDTSLHYTMDFDFWLKVSLKHRFYLIPETLAVYRFHGKSKSGFADWSSFYPEYNEVYGRYKKHSTILPDGPLATMAIALSREELDKSRWYLEKVKNTLFHLASQKIHDIEVIVITDVNEPQGVLDLSNLPFTVGFAGVSKLDDKSFYHAVAENARGFALLCPSIEMPLDMRWFSAGLTFLLTNRDTLAYVEDPSLRTLPAEHGTIIPASGASAPGTSTSGTSSFDTSTLAGTGGPHILVISDAMKVPRPFTYPRHAAPLITFIVAVNGEPPHMVYNSLFSIYENCTGYPYEVFCVACRGDTVDYIRTTCNAFIFETETGTVETGTFETHTVCFGTLNEAAQSAGGKYMIFLSARVVLTPSSISPIVETFSDFPRSGIAGGKTIYITGIIDNAACIVLDNGTSMKYGWCEPKRDPGYEYVREADFFPMGFFAIRNKVWTDTKGFDTSYSPWSCQDADLCFAVSELGYSVVYQPESEVINYDTRELIGLKGLNGLNVWQGAIKEYGATDFVRFQEKWRNRLEGRLIRSDKVLIERSIVVGGKSWVLFLCHKLSVDGPSARSIGLPLESFKNAGFNVAIHTEETIFAEGHRWLRRRGFKVFYNDVDFYEFIRDNALHFDVVWLEDRSIALHRAPTVRRFSRGLLIYDASVITEGEDFSTALASYENLAPYANVSPLQRLQMAKDRLIATIVDVAFTASTRYGQYLSSFDHALVVKPLPHEPAMDVKETMEKMADSRTRIIYGNGPEIYGEIIRLENEIKRIAGEEFRKTVENSRGRPLYIWGAGRGGRETRQLLASVGAEAEAFLDKKPDKWLTTVDGLPVYDPVSVLKKDTRKDFPFVVIGSIYGSAISS
ncbi:MAG: glycosyltransferase, partial [Nitrospirae bacterium]|nr:glycosyltransferase [Nitrospirota bacterium]